jgi:4'-phosphopantetheinyl transferase
MTLKPIQNCPWPVMPDDWRAQPQCVDVFALSLTAPPVNLSRALSLLDDGERKRHDRFKSPQRQGEFAITRAVLRMVIASVLRCDPASITFAHTEHGKPYLPNHPVHFNVTHSADLALIAVSPDLALGVDIECHRPRENFQKMAKRFFAPVEYDALMQLPTEKQFRAFHSIWTRKEAFVKAIAKGIALGLDQFAVNADPDEPAKLLQYPQHIPQAWVLHSLTPNPSPEYEACLCIAHEQPVIRQWQLR